jgi:hypothetical protein
MELGKKTWVFADGDLPPHGDSEPFGHEALMIVNNGEKDATIRLTILFDDKDPKEGIVLHVPARRVNCFRMDMPLGDEGFQLGPGQTATIVESDVPVVAVYGRLDRRKDMAYYPVQGFSC